MRMRTPDQAHIARTRMHTHTHTHNHEHTYTHAHTQPRTHIHAYAHARSHACTCTHICTLTHAQHTRTYLPSSGTHSWPSPCRMHCSTIHMHGGRPEPWGSGAWVGRGAHICCSVGPAPKARSFVEERVWLSVGWGGSRLSRLQGARGARAHGCKADHARMCKADHAYGCKADLARV